MEQRHRYPGEAATPLEIQRMAEEYRRAAELLLPTGRRGNPLSHAPFRLCAIHAVELYLNAFLLHNDYTPDKLRGLQHDLATRVELASSAGLKLRKRTILHLKQMHESREYLLTRYSPELTSTVSQLNRLNATLDELARKVAEELQIRIKCKPNAKSVPAN